MKVSFPGAVSWHSQVPPMLPTPNSLRPRKLLGSIGAATSETSACPYPSPRLFNLKNQQYPQPFHSAFPPRQRGEQKPWDCFSFSPDLWNSWSVYHLLVNQESLLDGPLRNASSSLQCEGLLPTPWQLQMLTFSPVICQDNHSGSANW